jgi:hypothetical protein
MQAGLLIGKKVLCCREVRRVTSTRVAVARLRSEVEAMMDDIGWFAGIDWASGKHKVWLLNANGQAVGEREVDHAGASLSELCD